MQASAGAAAFAAGTSANGSEVISAEEDRKRIEVLLNSSQPTLAGDMRSACLQNAVLTEAKEEEWRSPFHRLLMPDSCFHDFFCCLRNSKLLQPCKVTLACTIPSS